MTVTPSGSQRSRIGSRSTGMPPWSTTITARVAGVRAASIVLPDTLPVPASTSAKTVLAPRWLTALAVATEENEGRTTSSCGSTPATLSARRRAAVPLDTATA